MPTKSSDKIELAETLAVQYRFLHWPLEFPNVFHRERPGFDVVVGNPPWNEMTVEELAFYALRDAGLRGLPNLAERRRRIAELDEQNATWRGEFEAEQARLKTIRGFFTENGGYQLQGAGDKDLYQLFCERYTHLLREDGQLGVVLPRSAFLSVGAKAFRQWLFTDNKVHEVDILRNTKQWAFPITAQYRIALVTGQRITPPFDSLTKVTGPCESLLEFRAAVEQHGVRIRIASLGNAYVLPLLPSQRHADVLAILRRGIQFDTLKNPEAPQIARNASTVRCVVPHRELDETLQRALYSYPSGEGRVRAWRGRSFDQYEPHGDGFAGYCLWNETFDFLQNKRMRSPVFKRMFSASFLADSSTHPIHDCRVAFRHIGRASDSRTARACLIPPGIPLTNAAPYLIFSAWSARAKAHVLGVLNSLCLDWLARRYIERNFNFFILNMLTFPPPEDTPWERLGTLAARLSCVDLRFADFAAAAGVECGPLTDADHWDMRAEIDALVARAYGLNEDELRFVFTDFTENAVSPAYRTQVLAKFESL